MSEESFVEVADEPRHHPLFDNQFVRVYDFRLRPGEWTLYHRHSEDTFYVAIEPARIIDQPFGAEPDAEPISWPGGIAWCRGYGSEPVTHRVTNSGEEAMRVIGAELRQSPSITAPRALEARGYKLKREDPRLRVYRLDLAAGETTGPVDYAFSGLLVAVSSARLTLREGSQKRTRPVGAGDTHWHEGPVEVELSNTGEAPFRAYLAEWR